MKYNGWTNKETWLVNLWYGDTLLEDYIDNAVESVDAARVEESVRYLASECEAASLPAGLLSDFIETSFAVVDWRALAHSISQSLDWDWPMFDDDEE